MQESIQLTFGLNDVIPAKSERGNYYRYVGV